MSAVATVTLSVQVTGLAMGTQEILPSQVQIVNPIGEILQQVLAQGNNAILVPAGTNYIAIVPPISNTVALSLKGATTDTGIPVAPSNPSVIASPYASPTTIYLYAASAVTGPVTVAFF